MGTDSPLTAVSKSIFNIWLTFYRHCFNFLVVAESSSWALKCCADSVQACLLNGLPHVWETPRYEKIQLLFCMHVNFIYQKRSFLLSFLEQRAFVLPCPSLSYPPPASVTLFSLQQPPVWSPQQLHKTKKASHYSTNKGGGCGKGQLAYIQMRHANPTLHKSSIQSVSSGLVARTGPPALFISPSHQSGSNRKLDRVSHKYLPPAMQIRPAAQPPVTTGAAPHPPPCALICSWDALQS